MFKYDIVDFQATSFSLDCIFSLAKCFMLRSSDQVCQRKAETSSFFSVYFYTLILHPFLSLALWRSFWSSEIEGPSMSCIFSWRPDPYFSKTQHVSGHTFSFYEIIQSHWDYHCAMITYTCFSLTTTNLVLELATHSKAHARLETHCLSPIKNLIKNDWYPYYTTANAILYNTIIKTNPLTKGSMLWCGKCCCGRGSDTRSLSSTTSL